MAFVDELKIHIKAGRGGNGVVRFRHEKGREFMGPSGGDGGRGGDVYIVGVRDIGLLHKYRHKKSFDAENGEPGRKNSEFGKDGEDLEILLPIGSVVTNLKTKAVFELLEEGEKKLILRGGNGGYGNEHFKSSTNQVPKEWIPGQNGEEADFYIELKMVVDIGLIGLPNAGKSSLLNALTHAKAKVGNFNFTTLDPNLGDLYGVIIADIPGLIEGASSGKGLGHKFLRHIARTKVLAHCVSAENEDVLKVYHIINQELKDFSEEFEKKEEIIILTKIDVINEEEILRKKKVLENLGKEVLVSSINDSELVKNLSDRLSVIGKI